MNEYDLCFSPASFDEAGSYRLIELTPDLTSFLEGVIREGQTAQLTIKGQQDDNATLCTSEKTFTMRSVGLSNTLLVVTPVPDEKAEDFAEDAVVIRDQVKEIIELAPTVAKLHTLSTFIRNRQYDEGDEDDMDEERDNPLGYTFDKALRGVQASEGELRRGLIDQRILTINNELRPIAPCILDTHPAADLDPPCFSFSGHEAATVETLLASLIGDHGVPRKVSDQVLSWFGETNDGKWAMNAPAIVKELGVGVLRDYRHEPIEVDELLAKWKTQVGDRFESFVTLNLLAGNYVESDSIAGDTPMVKYFPASELPLEPAARFSDLFLTKSKWKADELAPFITSIAVNPKERDKLIMKYCRAISEGGVVRYTSRIYYTG